MILEHIQSPADVKSLEREQLPQLCQELREFWFSTYQRREDTWPPIWGP